MFLIPGLGPGIYGVLTAIGIKSLAQLTLQEPDSLSEKMKKADEKSKIMKIYLSGYRVYKLINEAKKLILKKGGGI